MEWLWGIALIGAPSGIDAKAGSTVTDSVRSIASGGRTPGGSGKGGPLLSPP